MKNNSGITMVEVVIMIVIMIMIAAFAIINGRSALDEADASDVYLEMTSMKEAVNSIIMKQNLDESFIIEEGKQYDTAFVPSTGVSYGDNVLGYQDEWYIIYGSEWGSSYYNSAVRKNLGLEAINRTYIVNYETGEVELYRPLSIFNSSVRTYDEVRTVVAES